MNWYKKIILAKDKRKWKMNDFLERLENYGAFVYRKAKKGYVLININNNQYTNIHYQNKDLGDNVVREVLKSLGIDVYSFQNNIPIEPVEEEQEEVIPDWQSSSWYQDQQKPLQEV